MPSATPPPLLQLHHISKRFGSLIANNDISLTLQAGEVLALLGENGAGKTTLMNILFGHYAADAGTIERSGQPLRIHSPKDAIQAGIGMVHQHFALADNLSVLDNVVLGTEPLWQWRRGKAAADKLRSLARQFGLEVDPDRKIAELSVGERQRVEILKALYRQVQILILDEPTAVLTPQESETLFATLRSLTQTGLAVVFISHKLPEVLAVSDRVIVLRSGRVVAELPTAAATPAQLTAHMVGRAIVPTQRQPMPLGEPVLELTDLTVAGSRSGGQARLNGVHLTVHQHEIVGIAGVSGNGQTTLFDLLSGLIPWQAGRLRLHGQAIDRLSPAAVVQAEVARIPEDRHSTGLIPDLSVWENAILERHADQFARAGLIQRSDAREYAQSLIQAYDVRCPGPAATVRLLSGGNMQKLILGRVLSQNPKLILASQPTRGLDLGAVAAIHQQLLNARSQGAGILLISEDLEELLKLSDRVHVLYRGQLSPTVPADQASMQSIGLMMMGETVQTQPEGDRLTSDPRLEDKPHAP